ncbi:hypothetical protein [Bacillus thuringiensis]|uniref:hypothetical protein n=1 Tax=Bacillus thuringiensis TaxID=1428 RepID=UPI0021CB3FD2|nr:hypothetical protein [Bacillus thuringiensis]MCU4173338.1 hypothetical protein [Bacillus thuringiensis]
MKFEITCLCGMNILASSGWKRNLKMKVQFTSVLPIITTEDNGNWRNHGKAQKKKLFM